MVGVSRRAFALASVAGERLGSALAFFGGQIAPLRRVLLPFEMAVDVGIAQDADVDAYGRASHHGEVERVARAGIDLDDPSRGLDHHYGIEDAFHKSGDPNLGQP